MKYTSEMEKKEEKPIYTREYRTISVIDGTTVQITKHEVRGYHSAPMNGVRRELSAMLFLSALASVIYFTRGVTNIEPSNIGIGFSAPALWTLKNLIINSFGIIIHSPFHTEEVILGTETSPTHHIRELPESADIELPPFPEDENR